MKSYLRERSPLTLFASLCLAVALTLTFASCGDIETTTSTTSTDQNTDIQRPALDATRQLAWGVVSASGGAALEGVLVETSSASSTSDKTGAYKVYLPSGPQTIKFSKDGYKTESCLVTGSVGTDTKLNVTLSSSSGGSGGTGGGTGGGTNSGDTFTVTEGARLERTATPTGKFTCKITNVDPAFNDGPNPIFYLYDPTTGYSGGRLTSGLSVDLLTHKIKVYDANGVYQGEPRFGTMWELNRVYDITVEWSNGVISATVSGVTRTVDCVMPSSFRIGIGYPPRIRAGLDGAKYTEIRWPTDSEVIE